MNAAAEVAVTDTITTALNRHMAHMAESVIQSAATSSAAGSSSGVNSAPTTKSALMEECGQLMSLWRPIMCRAGNPFVGVREFPSPAGDPPQLLPLGPPPSLPVNNNSMRYAKTSSGTKSFDYHMATSPGSPLVNSKSIPVHCVVMNTTTPCYLSDTLIAGWPAATNGGGGGASTGPASGGVAGVADKGTLTSGSALGDDVDVDSYAIIPASTLFTQIVPVVLRKLGYSDDVIFNANGWLMLKNWRPLSLTQIASSDRETVGGVLGELTTVATLRIYIRKSFSSNRSEAGSPNSDVKNKVLRWLMNQSQHLITSSRCPLDEKWQQKVMRGERPATPSSDTRRQFDAWYDQEMSRPSANIRPDAQSTPPSLVNLSSRSALVDNKLINSSVVNSHQRISPVDPLAVTDLSSTSVHQHHRTDGLPPRVRMRTTFDPEQELPRLQRWFAENQHPTRFQLQLYVQELNELESRRGRKPLDVSNLVYWFKNARAAYKRAEIRNHHHHHLNVSSDSVGADCWPMTTASSAPEEGSDVETRENLESSTTINDHQRDDAADDDDDDDDDDGEQDSSASESRKSCYDDQHQQHHVKSEPLDLNRGNNEEPADLSPNREPRENSNQQDSMTTNAVNEDNNETDDEASDCESDEDYAENLSLSKDDVSMKKEMNNVHHHQQTSDYAAAAAAAAVAGYPAFPLAGFNSQIGAHHAGLVYMASPYLQGIGSSLLHPSSAGPMNHHQQHRIDHHAMLSAGGAAAGGSGSHGSSSSAADDRRKRNRTFIDPVTEVPRLEHWFSLNTHPSHSLVLRYTEELNRQPYRLKFPKLEPKNVQFWFKNRRAKCKRLKLSL